MQLLLFPDPKPLVERLGRDFFRGAPDKPGVYLMRDKDDKVLYIGKARNLRKRLANYRVANPDRMARRHLRLLRAVHRIELQECPDESAALLRESMLLRALKPKFNRAGTWVGVPQYLAWRRHEAGLDLAVLSHVEPGWYFCGPIGMAALALRTALVRSIWSALHESGIVSIPKRWFQGYRLQVLTLPGKILTNSAGERVSALIQQVAQGDAESFKAWVDAQTSNHQCQFDASVRKLDLETINDFANRCALRLASVSVE
jgi:predicted GIY-YIG superfamily endonuclease